MLFINLVIVYILANVDIGKVMTKMSPKAHALYEAANDAAKNFQLVRKKSEPSAIYEWLLAEIRFADEVGMGFVTQPMKTLKNESRCQAYAEIAKALRLIRQSEFEDTVRATA